MAINYSSTIKDARMTVVLNAIDAGSGAGKLKIYNAAYALLLVSITLADPATTLLTGVLTFAGVPKSGTGVGAGDAALAKITDSNDLVVADGLTVGTSGTNIIIDNINIAVGQTVTLSSGSITHG